MSDSEFTGITNSLQDADADKRVIMLSILSNDPTGDKRILPFIEALLNDTAICLICCPIRFGEVRLQAAFALQQERRAMNIKEAVKLPATFPPLDTGEIVELAEQANIPKEGYGIESVRKTLQTLTEKGRIPLYDMELLSDEAGTLRKTPSRKSDSID